MPQTKLLLLSPDNSSSMSPGHCGPARAVLWSPVGGLGLPVLVLPSPHQKLDARLHLVARPSPLEPTRGPEPLLSPGASRAMCKLRAESGSSPDKKLCSLRRTVTTSGGSADPSKPTLPTHPWTLLHFRPAGPSIPRSCPEVRALYRLVFEPPSPCPLTLWSFV